MPDDQPQGGDRRDPAQPAAPRPAAAGQGPAAAPSPGQPSGQSPGHSQGQPPRSAGQPARPQAGSQAGTQAGSQIGTGRPGAPQPAARATPVQPRPAVEPRPVPPPVPAGQPQRRHYLLALSFVVVVVLPTLVTAWYLWTRAADQYASNLGFSVRREESSSAIELLGGITQLSGSSSSDTDILYKFLQSQELVADLDRQLDLRAIWSRAGPERDPVFTYHPPGTIEDLMAHWKRKVAIFYDSSSGLLDLRVLAFTPEDAQHIAQAIFRESSDMINKLSAIARRDSIRYAEEDLAQAVERLKSARQALTEFRNRNQIVDPSIDTQGQMGLVSTLQQQLAQALIDLDLLHETNTQAEDPRVLTAERKVRVIRERIAAERTKVGSGGDETYASLVGEYERLSVDQQFAEQAYTAALAAYDAARSDANRQSRYLAAHVEPTLPQKAEFPRRLRIAGLTALFLFLIWTVAALVAYSLRDRR